MMKRISGVEKLFICGHGCYILDHNVPLIVRWLKHSSAILDLRDVP